MNGKECEEVEVIIVEDTMGMELYGIHSKQECDTKSACFVEDAVMSGDVANTVMLMDVVKTNNPGNYREVSEI